MWGNLCLPSSPTHPSLIAASVFLQLMFDFLAIIPGEIIIRPTFSENPSHPPTPKPNEPIYMGFELCPCGDRIPIILPKRSNQVISNLNHLGVPSSISSPYFVEGLGLTWETFSNDHFLLAILSSGLPSSSAVKNSL